MKKVLFATLATLALSASAIEVGVNGTRDYSGAADGSALAAPLAFGICIFDIARHDRARVIAFFGRLGDGRQADIVVDYSAPQSRRRLGTGFSRLYQSTLVE